MSRGRSSRKQAGDAARGCSTAGPTRRWVAAAVVAALMLASQATLAQTVSTPVNITIPTILQITTNGSSIGFPNATDADYVAGYASSSSGPTLTHRGNVPYGITIQALSGSTLQFVPDGAHPAVDPLKPVGDLRLRATTGGAATAYVQVGAAASPVMLYSRGSRGGSLDSVIDARLALDYSKDPPGSYSTTVVFTIVAQ